MRRSTAGFDLPVVERLFIAFLSALQAHGLNG
jgi:hypothetical protein